MDRRDFLKQAAALLAAEALTGKTAVASEGFAPSPDAYGVLVDTTECIGCRKCELACDRKNKLTKQSDKSFEDTGVFARRRALSPTSLTIVNRYPNPANPAKPLYVKTQCMHCVKPACVSACIVGALRKTPGGPVTYDPDKCIGCRYCMVACPFQVPAYEYENAFTPAVKKCSFCFTGDNAPACVEACPVSTLTFGKRAHLLELGRAWMAKKPGRFTGEIYGEHQAGGTSWLYLAPVSFAAIGLPNIGAEAPPVMSETLQHSVFKNWIPPLSLYTILAASMWIFKRRDQHPHD